MDPGSSTSIRKSTGNFPILSKRVASQYFYYDPFDKPLPIGSKIRIFSKDKNAQNVQNFRTVRTEMPQPSLIMWKL
ncbi:hypothetical protein LEP1GSC070_3184 [Leptospira santarosai str. AIM]|nr:hypothetical protein LEP1GSC070_3184 [Leptospira santarosai str. AIM]